MRRAALSQLPFTNGSVTARDVEVAHLTDLQNGLIRVVRAMLRTMLFCQLLSALLS